MNFNQPHIINKGFVFHSVQNKMLLCHCVPRLSGVPTSLLWRAETHFVACVIAPAQGRLRMYIITCNILNIISNITGVGRRDPMCWSAILSATLLIWMKTPTSFRIKYRHSYRNSMTDPVWSASSFQMNNFQIWLSARNTWTFRVELIGMKSAQVVQSCPLISLHLRSTINVYDGMKPMTIRWIICTQWTPECNTSERNTDWTLGSQHSDWAP